ncbi:hypothetical protein SORBI_3002G325700, partial [Sorghum bicolor]
ADGVDLFSGRSMGSGLPPNRPQRAGVGDAWATPATPYARQVNFGGSSSAAASRGGGNVLGRQRTTTAPRGSGGQRTTTTSRGGGSQRVPRPRLPRAPRAAPTQTPASGAPFDIDEEMEHDVEELGSSGVPSVSHANRAQWNDANNACLLELCVDQRRAGTYNGTVMSGEGYQAVMDGLLARKGLFYTRLQVKNQIGILKNTHSFWRYLQTHTGLGRKPDGTIDAESDFWTTHTEKKPYLKRLQWGPPGNEDLLDELFRGFTVDGSTAFAPGDDYGQNQEEDAGAEEEEEFQTTPTSRSSQRNQRGKRSLSTSSTLTSPVKKSKNPMVKFVKDIASTFKDSVTVNTTQIQKRANEKAAYSVERCQELAFECGVQQTVDSVYAMSKLFESEYQRQFFCGKLSPQLRLGYFKKWCRDNNMSLGDVE